MSWRWAGALGLVGVSSAAFFACGEDAVPASSPGFDAARVPPGPCKLVPAPAPLCVPGMDSIPDASAPADASSPDGGGPVIAPESENRCLLTYDRALDCPSVIGPIATGVGPDGGTELVVAQRGVSPGDYQAYSDRISIDAAGNGTVTRGVAPPYSFRSGPTATVLMAGIPSSSFVLSGEDEAMTSSRVLIGPSLAPSISVPFAPPFRPSIFTAATGEGFLATRTTGPVLLLRGLPSAPRLVTTTTTIPNFGITTDPSGEPAGLFQETSTLHLLEGETFARERWSMETRTGGFGATLELAYVTKGGVTSPVFVTRSNDSDELRAFWLHDATKIDGFHLLSHTAKIGESYSTCPRANYLGVTCDACPVGQQCLAGEDDIVTTRLFTRGERVFVTYVAHDTRKTLAYARHTVPVVGVGCSCVLEEVSRQLSGDSLIVLELLDGGADARPLIVERMRLPLTPLGFVPAELDLSARPDGDMDVVIGPGSPIHFGDQTTTPGGPFTPCRVLRISTAAIP